MSDSSFYDENDDTSNSWDDAERYAGEAYELYETGLMQQALEKLHEAVSLNPSNSASYFNMGLTLDGLERYEEAIVCFQHALELSPNDVETLNCLAVDYTRTAQYDQALSTFETIEKLDPTFEPAYCNRIITYTEMEQYDKAEQMFYLAQEINPDCAICFYNIGNSLFTRGQYARAVWCWEKTASLEPTHPQIHYRIAQACWANGQIDKANENFLFELRKNPGNVEVLLDYSIFLIESNQVQRAQEKLNWILDLQPDFAPAVFYRGEIYRIQGKFDKAIAEYRRTIDADDKLAGPRFRLAQILMWQKETAEVPALLKAELQLSFTDEHALLLMGRMLLSLGEYDEAANCFLRTLDVNPEQPQAYFVMAAVLMNKRDVEGCLQFLEHAIGLGVKIPAAYTCAAMIHYKQKNYQQAQNIVNKAKETFGPSLHLSLWKLRLFLSEWKYTIIRFFRPQS